jgi:hypothetical protein
MKINNKKVIALFLIIAMANITPASALSVGEINNHIENDLNTYNNYSWWDKLWNVGDIISSLAHVASDLSAEITSLNNQAINAQNEASNLKNKLENLYSQINERKNQNQEELEYQKAGIEETKKSIEANSHESANITNGTNKSSNPNTSLDNQSNENSSSTKTNNTLTQNHTDSTNNSLNQNHTTDPSKTDISLNNSQTKGSESLDNNSNESSSNHTAIKSKETSSKLSLSNYAQEDGEKYPEAYFKSRDIKYTKLISSTSQLKKGQIVQILKDGVFKYWVFNGLTTDNDVTYISLITGNGKSYSDDMESFIEDFTGLTYELNESPHEENPYHTVKKIQQLQIKSLDSLNKKIDQQSTWASISNYILIAGGAITALGFILATACALCSIIYCIAAAATVTVVLGIPCATIAAIAAWAAVLTGAGALILLAIGLPLTVGGGIALGVLNSINEGDKTEYKRLKDDYESDEL